MVQVTLNLLLAENCYSKGVLTTELALSIHGELGDVLAFRK